MSLNFFKLFCSGRYALHHFLSVGLLVMVMLLLLVVMGSESAVAAITAGVDAAAVLIFLFKLL